MMASGFKRTVHPVVLNKSLQNHPAVLPLTQMECFKLLISEATPASSIQFPTLRSSCLILDAESLTVETTETCAKFCEISINPFILLCSLYATGDKIKEVIKAANTLTIELSLRFAGKNAHVIPVWSEKQAVDTVVMLIAPPQQIELKENYIDLDALKQKYDSQNQNDKIC